MSKKENLNKISLFTRTGTWILFSFLIVAMSILVGFFRIEYRIRRIEEQLSLPAKPVSPKDLNSTATPPIVLWQKIWALEEEVQKLKTQKDSIEPISTPEISAPRTFSNFKDLITSIQNDFISYDTDQNKKIDAVEANLLPAELKEYDWNQKGYVDSSDIDRIGKLLSQSREYAKKRDSKDGEFPIPEEQFQGSKKDFLFVDQSHDGIMEEEEYFNFLKKGWQETRRFDLDKDGKITPQEFGGSEIRFTAFDKNKDGYLDSSEVRKAMITSRW